MYHRFLIHSSADGYLGCFHVVAIANSFAMNTVVHVSLSLLVFFTKLNVSKIFNSLINDKLVAINVDAKKNSEQRHIKGIRNSEMNLQLDAQLVY